MSKLKLAALLLCLPGAVVADRGCYMTSITQSATEQTIAERTRVETVLVNGDPGRCIVTFRARVGAEWMPVYGTADWHRSQSPNDACALAMRTGEQDLLERLGQATVRVENVMVCSESDSEVADPVRDVVVGSAAGQSQFRPHPRYPGTFWHNGTECRFFVEPQFTGSNVRTFQGIACVVGGGSWVVIDKF